MNYLKKIVLFLLFLFSISNSFAVVTEIDNQSFSVYESVLPTDGSGGIGGIHFNDDGKRVFIIFVAHQDLGVSSGDIYVEEYTLSTPFDISSKSTNYVSRCNIKSHGISIVPYDLEFSSDGKSLFYASWGASDYIYRYDLTAPYNLTDCAYKHRSLDLDADDLQKFNSGSVPHDKNRARAVSFSDDGKKVFVGFQGVGTNYNTKVLEYNLSTPYDLTTISLNGGIDLDGEVANLNSIVFSSDGKRFFVTDHQNDEAGRDVTQVSLGSSFDTSSYTIDGRSDLNAISGINQLKAIAFSKNGLKMFIGNDYTDTSHLDDRIFEYDLECPFNIISGKCPSITVGDRTGMAEAQIEVARRTIENSTDNALNRLKWIRRNKDIQNLSHQNIKLNFSNEMLASLSEVINISTQPKKKNKDQDVFYWSEGSMSFGKIRKTSVASVKKIKTDGITVGVDKFTKNNGIKGLAFRFGKDDVKVGFEGSKLDTGTYNLTYYATSPLKDDSKYLDTVIGIGALKLDTLSVLDGQNLTGNRNGKQIYGTVKLKDEIKKDDLTLIPSGQIDLGYTLLSSYSESGKTGMRFDEQSIQSRVARLSIASVEEINHEKYKMKRHGKLEYKANLHRSSNIKYSYISDSTNAKFDTELTTEALHNINGEIGVDIIFSDNFSIFFIYEHNQALGAGYRNKIHIAIGYLPNKNTNYAFSINGSENLMSQLIIMKNINGYDLTFNLNDDLTNLGNNKEASINLNKVF